MNASEARKLSNDNVPKLIEQNFKDVVSNVNLKIKSAAQNGGFYAGLPISLPSNIQDQVIEKAKAHFENEGYEVKIQNLHLTKMFMVSWQK